jgi:hypothetical protein
VVVVVPAGARRGAFALIFASILEGPPLDGETVTRAWTPGTYDAALQAIAATPRLVVALDFDGTASPLVPIPMAARALPEVAMQVSRLADLPGTVVAYVSGRSMHDLRVITEHTDDSPIALVPGYWEPIRGRRRERRRCSRRTVGGSSPGHRSLPRR